MKTEYSIQELADILPIDYERVRQLIGLLQLKEGYHYRKVGTMKLLNNRGVKAIIDRPVGKRGPKPKGRVTQ
jgi:hypothetical protein